MSDVHSPEVRSKNMGAIRYRDTKPEVIIRRLLHQSGYRYRLNVKTILGKPDIVLKRLSSLIFIHGCFWHQHNCHLFKWPQTRKAFWKDKILKNVDNDKKNRERLEKDWKIAVIWECAIKGKTKLPLESLSTTLKCWLESTDKTLNIRGLKLCSH